MSSPADTDISPQSRFKQSRFGAGLREEGAKGALIAAASTLFFVGLFSILVVTSESWDKVQKQFFSWEEFRESWPKVLEGFWIDMRMFVVAEVLILVFALLIAVARSLRGPVFFPIRAMSILYIDIFRGIPTLLLIYLIGFGVPALRIAGLPSDPEFWAIMALTLSYSGYIAEVYRSGIESVPESQIASARSLGLSQWKTMRFAILPQAVRNVGPALVNGLVSLQKDVALASVLGIREAVQAATIHKDRTFNYTSFMVATLLFLIASIPLARFADWYAKRDRKRREQIVG